MSQLLIVLIAICLVVLFNSVRILKEWERGVILTVGRFTSIRGPGVQLVWPWVQKLIRVDQRIITMDVPGQDVITRDNVSVKVNAVLYYRVLHPEKAIISIENYHYATSQLAQTTMRSVCGEVELDDLLTKRDEINLKIQDIIDRSTDPWGIKVSIVELKHIDLPQEMQRAMAKQAEAERERRAKIIQAEGEFQASAKLTEAAAVMSAQPIAVQLRYLDTLRLIATEHNSTIVFPLPIDLMHALEGLVRKQGA